MHSLFRSLAVACLATALLSTIHAEEPSDDAIVIGVRRELRSKVLDEDRKLHIYAPNGYEVDKEERSQEEEIKLVPELPSYDGGEYRSASNSPIRRSWFRSRTAS